jgi:hypothetical protein
MQAAAHMLHRHIHAQMQQSDLHAGEGSGSRKFAFVRRLEWL